MAEGIDKTIWRARKRLLDLADEVREMTDRTDPTGRLRDEWWREDGDYDEPDPAWLDHVAEELRMVNWALHEAEGAAIRERHEREVA